MTFEIPTGSVVGSDTETVGLFWRQGDRPYCFGFSNDKGDTTVMSFPVDKFTREVKYDQRLDLLRDFYQDKSIVKVFHNAQFDVGMIESLGIKVRGEIICTMNLVRLCKSSASLALKPFCNQYLGIPNEDETALQEKTKEMRRLGRKEGWKIYVPVKKGKGKEDLAPDYWLAGPKYFEPYCALDAARAMAIYKILLPEIERSGRESLWKTECETWKVLRAIEKQGVRIVKSKVLNSKLKLTQKKKEYDKQARELVCNYWPDDQVKKINFNSHPQLKKLLYEDIGEEIRYYTETGLPSTDVNALKKMKHPLAKAVLNMRSCEKTVDFMSQYLRFMVQHENGLWYIHPSFSQSIPTTGRESSQNPNMQQVASGEVDKGADLRVEARSVFAPEPNYEWRSYDWKNIEVYIPAFLSNDRKLVPILKAGGDVHQNTSDSLTERLKFEVSRYNAKRVFFGLQYGIGIKKLAKDLGISEKAAEDIVYGFQNEYSDLYAWMQKIIMNVRRDGFVITPYHRKLEIPREAAYKGTNYLVQGTASSILKEAKVKVFHALKSYKARIILPVHDEMLIKIRKDQDFDKIDSIVVNAMQDNPALKMPVNIPVSISRITKGWSKKEKVKVI